ncbi:hypothetical protein [Nonomuraea sp. SYSU D8015]|uniref:hypothetical protein n=1 Tax=Nonomuraea sp. SYSU D8015 TaxID=2593644 RepID=UPI001660637C|nr:hypothetical protein [Nonomuraea sp. SYSU D8015]
MSVEVTIVCDGCATLLAAGKTAQTARRSIPDHLPVRLSRPGGKDYCDIECERADRG